MPWRAPGSRLRARFILQVAAPLPEHVEQLPDDEIDRLLTKMLVNRDRIARLATAPAVVPVKAARRQR